MKEQLKKLEQESLKLEPGQDERKAQSQPVMQYVGQFLEDIDSAKAYFGEPERLEVGMPAEEGHSPEDLVGVVRDQVQPTGINAASGYHFGYIPGGGIYTASLGDYMAAVTDCYAGVYYASPGAVKVEKQMVRWMAELAGYPEGAAGNLSSGGSIANLTALVTARRSRGIRSRDFERTTVYFTHQVHHCVLKALQVMGMEDVIIREVPMTERLEMRVDELKRMIAEDRDQGLQPWVVIASAGTTDAGAVDPINEIADVAEAEDLWFHVDGAYGAFFLLTEEGRRLFRGIERSDSLVMDPHKGLFLPYGTGAVLIRDGNLLKETFSFNANYLQDSLDVQEQWNPSDLSPELTRHWRGLRMWLPLMLHGVKPFRAALEEKLLLAKYFHQELDGRAGWELGPEPRLSVVMFRYRPAAGDDNEFNKKLLDRLKADGQVFLSSTNIRGTFWLRICILGFRSHLQHVDTLIHKLEGLVQEQLEEA